MSIVPTGPKDIRDEAWLAEQVADLGRGIEAARAIWSNWFDGRQVGRLHPGQTPGEYIGSLGMRLTLPEALAAMPDASTRQVAAVAGVSKDTVRRAVGAFAPPEPIRGADGKSYPRVVRAAVPTIEYSEPAMVGEVVDIHAELSAVRAAMQAVINMKGDIERVLEYCQPTDHVALRKLAQRAIRTLSELDRDIIFMER